MPNKRSISLKINNREIFLKKAITRDSEQFRSYVGDIVGSATCQCKRELIRYELQPQWKSGSIPVPTQDQQGFWYWFRPRIRVLAWDFCRAGVNFVHVSHCILELWGITYFISTDVSSFGNSSSAP